MNEEKSGKLKKMGKKKKLWRKAQEKKKNTYFGKRKENEEKKRKLKNIRCSKGNDEPTDESYVYIFHRKKKNRTGARERKRVK